MWQVLSFLLLAVSIHIPPFKVEAYCNLFMFVAHQALEAGFSEPSSYHELWLTFIDYKRRATRFDKEETDSMRDLRTVFERARLHLGEIGGDPGHEVAKYQANLEADQYGSMDIARQIWAAILQVSAWRQVLPVLLSQLSFHLI